MNSYHIVWASQHDWFLMVLIGTPSNDGYCIVVRDDLDPTKELEFWDFQELRAWAGY